jgi:hypothetical protein
VLEVYLYVQCLSSNSVGCRNISSYSSVFREQAVGLARHRQDRSLAWQACTAVEGHDCILGRFNIAAVSVKP